MKKILLLVVFLVTGLAGVHAESVIESAIAENISTDTTAVKKKSALATWWQNFAHGNVDRTFEKPIDITFAASPYYSKESSVGIGGQVSAIYRVDRTDSLLHVSDFTIMGGGSLNGTYSVGIQGNTHFTRNSRLSYTAAFRHQARKFWGISYNDCSSNAAVDDNVERIELHADYKQRIYHNWFWGAALRLDYISIDLDSVQYLRGQDKRGFFAGVGALIQYDSRDFLLNPQKGVHFLLREIVYPKALGHLKHNVFCTTVQFNAYHKIWKDALLAYDLFGEFNTSNGEVPWQLREQICVDDRRMRGYYTGSYIDCSQMCAQVELRQHLYKRIGAVAWVGAGTLFDAVTEIHGGQILPNYGVGMRFEMKPQTNIRVEVGFGRGTSSLVFNYAEAF